MLYNIMLNCSKGIIVLRSPSNRLNKYSHFASIRQNNCRQQSTVLGPLLRDVRQSNQSASTMDDEEGLPLKDVST